MNSNGNGYSYSYPYTVNDWMKAVRTPTPYRVGNARFHLKPRMVAYAGMFATAVLILLIYFIPTTQRTKLSMPCQRDFVDTLTKKVDTTYPLTEPIVTQHGIQYRIAIVTDLDTASKSGKKENIWLSFMVYGNLTLSDDHRKVTITFEAEPVTLTSSVSQGGRGMELSELVTFNGKLYTVDDRTGFVYEIWKNQAIPWVVLTDGDGRQMKGTCALFSSFTSFLNTALGIIVLVCYISSLNST